MQVVSPPLNAYDCNHGGGGGPDSITGTTLSITWLLPVLATATNLPLPKVIAAHWALEVGG